MSTQFLKGSLSDLLDKQIFPKLFEKLDIEFPEFGFENHGDAWVATEWPDGLPYPVEDHRPDRLTVYRDTPFYLKIHGHEGLTWLQYLAGGETPHGEEFVSIVEKLACLAEVPMPKNKMSPEEIEEHRFVEERRRCLAVVIKTGNHILFNTSEGNVAVDYCLNRGLNDNDMTDLEIGFYRCVDDFESELRKNGCDIDVADRAGLLWRKLEGYIMVPWRDAIGQPLTIYGRWHQKTPPEGIPKTIALPGKGTKSSPLYFDRARKAGHKDLVAVEGVFDGALIQTLGDTRVVAYVGAQFTKAQIRTLANYGVKSVVIVPDPDGGGDRGAIASVKALERAGIRSYVGSGLPNGQDPDEFALDVGLDGWIDHVERAIPGSVHHAKVLLEGTTPESPEKDRRTIVEHVAAYVANLHGTWVDADRKQIMTDTSTATGFELDELTEIFSEKTYNSINDGMSTQLIEPRVAEFFKTGDVHFTDFGNAQLLAATHGDDLKNIAGVGWHVWTGNRWMKDETGEVVRRAKSTIRALYTQAKNIDNDEARRALVKHAMSSESENHIKAMINLATTEPQLVARVEDLDANDYLLNTLSGTIDLRTGELRPHNRKDLITKLAPVQYNPNAECPRFLEFLNQIFDGNEELISFVQRAFGYVLTGSVKEQCLIFLHGAGANGKSTLVLLMMYVLGDYAKQAAPNLLVSKRWEDHPTSIADLCGARLVVSTEVDSGKSMAEGLVKQITGGDKIKARYMRRDFFEFEPSFKIVLSANHKPLVKGTDHAIWRRLRLVPFSVTFSEDKRDPNLLDKLKAEAPGILAWAVRGCIKWQQEGLGVPEDVTNATDDYREEMDVMGKFIEECCEVGKGLKVPTGELYETYLTWCRRNGEYTTSKRLFGERLNERGFGKSKSGSTRYRLGLKLNTEDGTVGTVCDPSFRLNSIKAS